MATCATTAQISAADLYEIKTGLGFPLVDELDWGEQSDEYIKRAVLSRVLRIYFTYFPLKYDQEVFINTMFTIDYPEDTTIFRKYRHFFNYKSDTLGNFNNPFFLQTQVMYRSGGSPLMKPYATQEIFGRLTTMESLIDFGRSLKVEDYPNERKVKGFTDTPGKLFIQWAKMSFNFDDIQFIHKDDAISLAKAYLMQDAARLRDSVQVTSNKIQINVGTLTADAEKLETAVLAKWKGRNSAVFVK